MRAIDLFSGPGGLSLGMKAAGITPIVSVEKNRDAIETYSEHTSDSTHFCRDIRGLSFEQYRGAADVVFGGPPCQPFSTGGLRRGTSDARNMFPEFMRVLEEVRPAAFLAENVPGLATKQRIHYLADLIAQFENIGFNVSWKVISAADHGVPQKRKRLFIVGMRKSEFWFPKPSHGPDGKTKYVPTSSIVSKQIPLGEPPDCPVVFAKYPDPRPSPYAGHVYNGGGRPIDLDGPCHTILASAGGYKTHWVDMDDIAPPYTKHLLDGGRPWEGSVPGARRLTVEESALLQTFPKGMRFSGSKSSQYRQVGDAVPPQLARVLGEALRDQLSGKTVSLETHYPSEASIPLLTVAR